MMFGMYDVLEICHSIKNMVVVVVVVVVVSKIAAAAAASTTDTSAVNLIQSISEVL